MAGRNGRSVVPMWGNHARGLGDSVPRPGQRMLGRSLRHRGTTGTLPVYTEGYIMGYTATGNGLTLNERRALCGSIELAGGRANVGGARNRFASVVYYATGMEEEYAWETIERLRGLN